MTALKPLLFLILVQGFCFAQSLKRDEALALAFPGCSFDRDTVTLTKAQRKQAEATAGTALRSALVISYHAMKDGERQGTVYFDPHKVRTLPELLMIAVGADDTIQRIEVIEFREPAEYKASETWLKQFYGKPLTPDLQLKRQINPMTGSTLTARAATDASRRVLAVHQALER